MKFNVGFEPIYCLKKAGYQFHKQGLIKEEKGGRFHAYVIKFDEVDLHYDKYQEGYHSAAPKLNKLKAEARRIRKSFNV